MSINWDASGGRQIEEHATILRSENPKDLVDVPVGTVCSAGRLQSVLDPLEVSDTQKRNRSRAGRLVTAAAQTDVEDDVAILVNDLPDSRVVVAVLKL